MTPFLLRFTTAVSQRWPFAHFQLLTPLARELIVEGSQPSASAASSGKTSSSDAPALGLAVPAPAHFCEQYFPPRVGTSKGAPQVSHVDRTSMLATLWAGSVAIRWDDVSVVVECDLYLSFCAEL